MEKDAKRFRLKAKVFTSRMENKTDNHGILAISGQMWYLCACSLKRSHSSSSKPVVQGLLRLD